jgi:serralysin
VDRIDGLGGDDEIFGSPRDDVLAGGAGRDELTGGGGRDVFLVDVVAHSTPGRPDVVHDFVAGEDRIDLAGIDADVGIEGRQSFAYVGTSPFSGIAGELRASFVSSGRWLLQGDIDGDQAADVSLMLLGVHAPGPGDILT